MKLVTNRIEKLNVSGADPKTDAGKNFYIEEIKKEQFISSW